MAHFLTGLHECHWVKRSPSDQFWGILSIESETDRRVGVTKCNDDMEVTEIRLGMFLCLCFIDFIIEAVCAQNFVSNLAFCYLLNDHKPQPILTWLDSYQKRSSGWAA
jgi:hypothetical protein